MDLSRVARFVKPACAVRNEDSRYETEQNPSMQTCASRESDSVTVSFQAVVTPWRFNKSIFVYNSRAFLYFTYIFLKMIPSMTNFNFLEKQNRPT